LRDYAEDGEAVIGEENRAAKTCGTRD